VDELDDLLSDIDDDDEQGELPVSHPRQSAASLTAPKPAPKEEDGDGLFDAILDEPLAEPPAASAGKGPPGPSSAAVTLRAAKPTGGPSLPSLAPDDDDDDENEPTRAIASVRGIAEAIAAATAAEAGEAAEEEPSAEDLEAIAAAEALDDEPATSLRVGPESLPGGDADGSPPSVLTPPSLRPVPPKTFPHEQDASVRLLQDHQRDAWAARATWLHAEAQALEDKVARARALVTVSELFAMAGEEATARTIAAEARDLAPSLPFAQRQLRGLLDREGDSKGVLEVLDAEARVMPTPSARTHSVLLAAEVARLRLGDPEGAKKRFEQASRVLPADPRAHLQRFCEALAAPDPDPQAPAELPRIPLPDAKDLAPLGKAFAQVAAHRGLPVKGNRLPGSLYESLLRARAFLGKGDVASALSNIDALRNAPELAGGAGWIAAVLAGSKAETRKRAVEALQSVLGGSHGDVARRALAGYAVELADAQAARAAMEGATSSAFEAGDRVALAALTGGSREEAEPWLNALLGDSELSPITAAASAALGSPTDENRKLYPVGSLRSKAAVSLGRMLASVMDRKDRSLSSNREFDDAVSRTRTWPPTMGSLVPSSSSSMSTRAGARGSRRSSPRGRRTISIGIGIRPWPALSSGRRRARSRGPSPISIERA
jgi:hypothetical protein